MLGNNHTTMTRSFFGIFAILFLAGSHSFTLVAREAQRDSDDGPPRLTPEQRREQWEQMRQLSPEERRARLQELRENRGRGEESLPELPAPQTPPENYLEQLELRSITTVDGVTEFGLHNPYENRTFLVSAEEGRHGIEVVGFDAAENALTLSHDGETRTLYLQSARVAELDQASDGAGDRRQMWEDRRERFRRFRETWEAAVDESPELQEIQAQFRELVGDFRENRNALRAAEEGTPEHDRLRAQEQEMREEFRLLSEYSLLEMKKNPAFKEEEIESLEGMMRGMMFRGSRGEGDRDDGDRGDGRRGRN